MLLTIFFLLLIGVISATAFVQFSKIDVKITHNNSCVKKREHNSFDLFFLRTSPG